MKTNPIVQLAFALRKISTPTNCNEKLQELERCMHNFKLWVKTVLGDDYEEIIIPKSADMNNYQEQIEKATEQLRISYVNVHCEIDSLKNIPDIIFSSPKISNIINCGNDSDYARVPAVLTIPPPVDEETAAIYEEYVKITIQQMQIVEKYLVLISKKRKKNRPQFIINLQEETYEHYDNVYTQSQLLYILKTLKEKGYIANDTDENSFIYFFSGRGDVPTHGLEWKSTQIGLAVFLKVFYYNDTQIWMKAENIFGIKNLSKTYSNNAESPKGQVHEKYFMELYKTINQL